MNLELLNKQIENRKDILLHYAPTSFFRKQADHSFEFFVKKEILSEKDQNKFFIKSIDNELYHFFYEYLAWDSKFFEMPTYKLKFVIFDSENYTNLLKAISAFKDEVVKENYIFTEIPSEDVYLMQALNESLFRLVETRMTYYLDLKNYNNKRYNVREAIIGDIPNLKKVSSKMVNPYDRFHADVFYNKKVADNFLGVFAEESVKGFADYVLVPDEDGLPSDSFLTVRYNKEWWGEINIKVSKMVLSAVSSTTNKGWYIKLISEMALHLKELGVDFVMMHPASTNKAVIHSYEKLGCKLGKVTHILSYKKR
jgi:dTDP-4-amino-4,6-dideoxy-D-galactose acyltransferase|tara:strand:- start:1461 stop:2393 length:933 start_codon:yes stop_codon:yes gene_type:complete